MLQPEAAFRKIMGVTGWTFLMGIYSSMRSFLVKNNIYWEPQVASLAPGAMSTHKSQGLSIQHVFTRNKTGKTTLHLFFLPCSGKNFFPVLVSFLCCNMPDPFSKIVKHKDWFEKRLDSFNLAIVARLFNAQAEMRSFAGVVGLINLGFQTRQAHLRPTHRRLLQYFCSKHTCALRALHLCMRK